MQIPNDLQKAVEYVYRSIDLHIHTIVQQQEGIGYGSFIFHLNNLRIIFRIAKRTPTKTGQFVTLWKRSENGPIIPYDISDPYDFYIISVRKNNQLGQFIFPKDILYQKGILSENNQGGKRALRVYAPWDITESKQAQKTQEWQSRYFFEIDSAASDIERIKELFKISQS